MAANEVVIRSNKFPKLARRFPEEVSKIVGKTVFDLQSITQSTSPFRTGFLAASHQGRFHKGALEGELYIGAEYAGHVEYGTSRGIRGRHWVRDGVRAVKPGFVAALSDLEKRL